jgi:hypothetical protein
MARRKQKAVVAAVRDCPDRDDAAGSIPTSCQSERALDQLPTTAPRTWSCLHRLCIVVILATATCQRERSRMDSPFQSEQESDGRETPTEDVRSQCVSTLTSDCHSGEFLCRRPLTLALVLTRKVTGSASAFTGRSPSPPAMVIREATEPVHGTVIQGVPRRKRTQSSTQPNVLSGDGAPRKTASPRNQGDVEGERGKRATGKGPRPSRLRHH